MYEQEKIEIATLKSYLLSHIPTTLLPPNDILLSPKSVALTAAVAGLDKELVRLEREERLVKKFTANNDVAAAATGVDDADMDYVKMNKEDVTMDDKKDNATTADNDEEEWEEATNPSPAKKHARQENKEQMEDENATKLCQTLASSAVARIANANIKVVTPLGALGLALHTALVELSQDEQDPLFRCTGVPDLDVTFQLLASSIKSTKKAGEGGGGFAPPIRELPRGELVPPKWEGRDDVIAFRYKCGKEVYAVDSGHTNDATTVYLTLQLMQGDEVSVTFGTLPSSKDKKSGEKRQLKFPLGQHVNLDGFQAAKTKNGGRAALVSPLLLYISLPKLLLDFSSTFDVLPLIMGKGNDESSSLEMPTKKDVMGLQFEQSIPMPTTETSRADFNDPLRVMDSHQRGKRHGDFEGDLLPGGPNQPGGLHEMPPRGMGSQVGPDHPMFDRTFGDDYNGNYDDEFDGGFGNGGGSFGAPGVGGGMSMRPRFDPYGPPGGPTEPGRGGRYPGRGTRLGRGRGRGGRGGRGGRMPPPGGFGHPNPDHMNPPGGAYFS
mmetsp:Transcript_24664/g.53208  ORF Transcript_24664/g.53208 Transcript_24664/m.53208 type:complete len:551 (-) Transcript_24664:205-1857(-)